MNESQKRACAILDGMVSAKIAERSKDLLTSFEADADSRKEPGNWCEGWAFIVPPAFGRALDCCVTARFAVENVKDAQGKFVQDVDEDGKPLFDKKGKPKWKKYKRKYLEWTQGSAFNFGAGYTLQRRDGSMAIQIHEPLPAVPATYDLEVWPERPGDIEERIRAAESANREAVYSYDTKAPPEKRCQLRIFKKRVPGILRLQTYAPDSGPTIWKEDQLLTLTQDDLVRFLITGEKP